jgi:hypothetical protein
MNYVHAILEIIALSYKLVALHEGRLNFTMVARKALIKNKMQVEKSNECDILLPVFGGDSVTRGWSGSAQKVSDRLSISKYLSKHIIYYRLILSRA